MREVPSKNPIAVPMTSEMMMKIAIDESLMSPIVAGGGDNDA